MAGPAFADAAGGGVRPPQLFLDRVAARIEIPSDDWPYLYLRDRGVSGFYGLLIALFTLLSLLGILVASREMRASLTRGRGVDPEMFLFGLGFLLLETKSVTQTNLLWGATWLTSAAVFGAILAMMLLATLLMQVRALPWRVSMAGLVVSLLASHAVPASMLLAAEPLVRLLLSVVFVGTPIFFASACFAVAFARRHAVDLAFGWNLLGAVAGGFCEFLSMAVGFRALSLLALAAHLATALLRGRDGAVNGTVPPVSAAGP
jgi:hypothetical protein